MTERGPQPEQRKPGIDIEEVLKKIEEGSAYKLIDFEHKGRDFRVAMYDLQEIKRQERHPKISGIDKKKPVEYNAVLVVTNSDLEVLGQLKGHVVIAGQGYVSINVMNIGKNDESDVEHVPGLVRASIINTMEQGVFDVWYSTGSKNLMPDGKKMYQKIIDYINDPENDSNLQITIGTSYGGVERHEITKKKR